MKFNFFKPSKGDNSKNFNDTKVPILIFQNNKIVTVNTACCKLFGYSKKEMENKSLDFIISKNSKLNKKEIMGIVKDLINENLYCHVDTTIFKNYKGEDIWVKFIATPIIYNDKLAVQVISEDFTRNKYVFDNAVAIADDLKVIQNISKVSIGHRTQNKYIWTDEIYDILETNDTSNEFCEDIVLSHIVNEDKNKYLKVFDLPNNHEPYDVLIRVRTDKGKLKYLSTYFVAKEIHNNIAHVSFIQDVTDSVVREKKLEDTLEDRKILIQEVHHRVKNNLQIILSLMNLESRFHTDQPDLIIEQTKDRIRSMAVMHEKIYQSVDMSQVNVKDYINADVVNTLDMNSANYIKLSLDLEDIYLDMGVAIPLGLIINEIVNNSIQHAYPNKDSGQIDISLHSIDEEKVYLEIGDDGVGVASSNFNLDNPTTLGLIIIKSLTRQIHGEVHLVDKTGTNFKFIIPRELP